MLRRPDTEALVRAADDAPLYFKYPVCHILARSRWSKNILLFLGWLFGLLLNLLGLFLDGLGYLLHDDLFDLLLELLCLPTLILNGFRHLLLDRLKRLGNDLLRYLFMDLLCHLDGFRLFRLLGDRGTYLCHRSHPLFQDLLRLDRAESLQQEGDDPSPAGLMTGPNACT